MCVDKDVRYMESGPWVLPAVPLKRSKEGKLQLAVAFSCFGDDVHPLRLVLCEAEETIWTFIEASGLTKYGHDVMHRRGEPYTAPQIVEQGWRVD